MDEWRSQMRRGRLDVLINILDRFGSLAAPALGHLSTGEQVDLWEKALFNVRRRTRRHRGTDFFETVRRVLAEELGIQEQALHGDAGAPLEKRIRLQILHRVAEQEAMHRAREDRRKLYLLFIATTIGLFSFFGIVRFTTLGIPSAHMAAEYLGDYSALYDAPDINAWVLASGAEQPVLTYIAQPGNQYAVGTTLASLEVEGRLLAVLNDGTFVSESGRRLLRRGLEGELWSIPRPTGNLILLSNGVLLAVDESSTQRMVTAYSPEGVPADVTTLPTAGPVTYTARGNDSWLAMVTTGEAAQVFASTGELLHESPLPSRLPEQALLAANGQIALFGDDAFLYGLGAHGEWATSVLPRNLRTQPLGVNVQIYYLPESNAFQLITQANETGKSTISASLALVSDTGKMLWRYNHGVPAHAHFRPVLVDRGIVLSLNRRPWQLDRVFVHNSTNGRIISEIPLSRTVSSGAGLVDEEDGRAWIMLVYRDRAALYRTR